MFGIVDLIVVAGIKDALQFLSANPRHIEFILGSFCQGPIKHMVGQRHIKECVDFIQNNRIEVGPYYQMDLKKRPSVSVVASYVESQQYMGDFGEDQAPVLTLPALVYAEFNAKAFAGCGLLVSAGLKLEEKLWVGMEVTNGTLTKKIKGILVREGQDTEIMVNDPPIPEGTSLAGWKAVSGLRQKGYVVNASTDDVNIQMNLQTLGDYATHRMIATVIRYCLKKQRLWFDQYGLQVATYSQTPPVLTEENEGEYQTIFTINAKFTDTWIAKEFDLADPNANIKIEVVAHSDILPNERTDVDLDE